MPPTRPRALTWGAWTTLAKTHQRCRGACACTHPSVAGAHARAAGDAPANRAAPGACSRVQGQRNGAARHPHEPLRAAPGIGRRLQPGMGRRPSHAPPPCTMWARLGFPMPSCKSPASSPPKNGGDAKPPPTLAPKSLGTTPLAGVLRLARTVALYHHEKWNGTGYPQGWLAPTFRWRPARCSGRCVRCLDQRAPYKKAWAPEEAMALIELKPGSISTRNWWRCLCH